MYEKIYQIFLQRVVRNDRRKPEKDIKFFLKDGNIVLETPDLMIRYDGREIYLQRDDGCGIWETTEDPNEIERTLKTLNPDPMYVSLHRFDSYHFHNTLDLDELRELRRNTNRSENYQDFTFLRRHHYDPRFLDTITTTSTSFEETMSFGWAEGTYTLLKRDGYAGFKYDLYSPLYTALIPHHKLFAFRTSLRAIKPRITIRSALEIFERGGIDKVTAETLKELFTLDPLANLREWNWPVDGIKYYISDYELYD